MNILSFNPGHDGAIVYISDGHLIYSIEAEKNSRYRHSPLSVPDLLDALSELKDSPDVICRGGWWPTNDDLPGPAKAAGYHGTDISGIITKSARFLGRDSKYFSSTHERSHLLCAFGMSDLPKGTPCYALLWEGVIGSFYEIDSNLNIKKVGDVMPEPGHRYSLLYGLADPTFDVKSAEFSRFSDAGKLMALASFSKRDQPSQEDEMILAFLMQDKAHLRPQECEDLRSSKYYNIGLDDPEFRNLAGIFSDRIFDRFYKYAERNLRKGMPLLIVGGCGLNCDWNSKWKDSGFFSYVFVPPVANDSGSAIGTALDAQFALTREPKLNWSVYAGLEFRKDQLCDASAFEQFDASDEVLADMLASGLIFGWANGKYEIGPRALGNRSILAAPFEESTRVLLNEIKQREQFRPIAPVCLEEEAQKWFGCSDPSPHMLYTQIVRTEKLPAITHVNKTARIQTVSRSSNARIYSLLRAFSARTGFGVLCNTSLNFKGRGFINTLFDLSSYTLHHGLDGFVVEGRAYMVKSSGKFRAYLSTRADSAA